MEDPPGVRLELHNGEVVEMTRPKHKHAVIQTNILSLLGTALGDKGWATIEFSFRAKPEGNLRVADVGWVSSARFDAIDPDDNLYGAPEIVVEVLSPSNRAGDLLEKRDLCFGAGCEEFWIVDAKRGVVEVWRPDSTVHVYRRGDRIPVGGSGGSVDEVLGA